MAPKTADRRRRQVAPPGKSRRVPAPTPPAAIPDRPADSETIAPLMRPEVEQLAADAADRAADLRDQGADDAARILADGEARATALLDHARTEAALLVEEAVTEQARLVTAAAADAEQVRTEAANTATADADRVRRDAGAAAERLLADARREAATLTTAAASEADHLRSAAATDAAKVVADTEKTRTELLATAQRASNEAEQRLARAREEAKSLDAEACRQAAATTARAQQDARRAVDAAGQEAQRAKRLAEEDVQRLRRTAAEDAERLARTARQEADRVLELARRSAATLQEAADTALAEAQQKGEDADVTLKAADKFVAEATARWKRATDPTERHLARKRLRHQARLERREDKSALRAGRLTLGARAGRLRDWGRGLVANQARRVLVSGPIAAPMAVAWWSQMDYAKDAFGWMTIFAVGFAAAWELTTAFTGWMYHQARKDGDAGTIYRVMTWVFASGAATMNYAHHCGPGGRPTQAAVAFATMSIVGMVLWELYASLIHRKALREQGLAARARPRIGVIRWIRYPRHSFTAWSLAITDPTLSTLDRAWAAAGPELADREAVRTGRTLHRVVVPRLSIKDHGPVGIPTVLTIIRMDRPGPLAKGPDRGGPTPGSSVRIPVRSGATEVRSGGPDRALESGPTDRSPSALVRSGGPDRTGQATPASRTTSTANGTAVRTGATDHTERGPVRGEMSTGPDRSAANAPERTGHPGPDQTVITLSDLERRAVDRLRSGNRPLNRANIAEAVRAEGGTIATDRAGQIAVALKQHVDR
ncbi:hypothetical protein ACFQ7N_10235 [Streptomyces niveus]|uniref:hypothetical protein n=1 Tax=Streptomyces niveus TaxID=193462 RepID=UPI0036C43C88